MDDPAATHALPYLPGPVRERPPRKPFSVWEIACWIALVLVVAVPIAFPDLARSKASVLTPAQASRVMPPPPMDLLLQSRYVVGVSQLMRATKQPAPAGLTDALDRSAQTDADRFREQLVIRELKGPDAARTALETFAAKDDALGADARLILQRDGVEPAKDLSVSTPEELQAHHGWFGALALSHDLPDSDPRRAAPIDAAERTLLAFLGAFGIAGIATLVGLGLLILFIVWRATGKLRPAKLPPDASPQRRPYLTGFTIYVALISTVSLALLQLGAPNWVLVLLYFGSPFLAILWVLICGHSWKQIRATTGFNLGKGFFREIFAGIIGYIAGLPLLVVGVIFTILLMRLSGLNASHPIEGAISTNPIRLAILLGLASVYAPLTEELLFRGFLYEHLRWRLGYVSSAIISAFIFAAVHPQGWPAIPTLGAIAFTLATLREYRGSLLPGMAAHALNNTFVLILLAVAIS
ncbi:MAG TPA: type II CAAX endopeptidase family protein [Phycisphaerae bacterium]|nr:type II CAAX endopeptidase family protein [Phycisphaerae bacterium]